VSKDAANRLRRVALSGPTFHPGEARATICGGGTTVTSSVGGTASDWLSATSW